MWSLIGGQGHKARPNIDGMVRMMTNGQGHAALLGDDDEVASGECHMHRYLSGRVATGIGDRHAW